MKLTVLFTLLISYARSSPVHPNPILPATTYADCQRITPDPLHGCPKGTIYVSQDASTEKHAHSHSHFTSITSAIRSLPNDTSSHIILIAAGTYHEQLNVTRPGPLTLLGQSDLPFLGSSYSATAGHHKVTNPNPSNLVQIYHNAANYNATYPDNLYTSVLAVGPTYNATLTGAGPTGYPVDPSTPFGNTDFRAYNIDFRNEFVPYADGPALTLSVGYANSGFYSCGFYSWQDTIYVGKLGQTLLHDSIVAGQVDFLYGFGTLFVSRSTLLLRSCGGGITAWKGTNVTATTTDDDEDENNHYGVYIKDSQVLAANATIAEEIKGGCSLGRPWNELQRSLFAGTYLDGSILPQGYTKWAGATGGDGGNFKKGVTEMAVYKNYGPGSDVEAERESNVTLVWDREEAERYLKPAGVFVTPLGGDNKPDVSWLDQTISF